MSSASSSDQHLSCPLCESTFTTADNSTNIPLMLPCCGQSICSQCFSQLRTARCPFDQSYLPVSSSSKSGVQLLPLVRNRALMELIERLSNKSTTASSSSNPLLCSNECLNPASVFCASCGYHFCLQCNTSIHSPKPFRLHVRIPVEDIHQSSNIRSSTEYPSCIDHPGNSLSLYCQQCHEPACLVCIVLKHQIHLQQLIPINHKQQFEQVTLNTKEVEGINQRAEESRTDVQNKLDERTRNMVQLLQQSSHEKKRLRNDEPEDGKYEVAAEAENSWKKVKLEQENDGASEAVSLNAPQHRDLLASSSLAAAAAASSSSNNSVELAAAGYIAGHEGKFDAANISCFQSLNQKRGIIYVVQFSPDGQLLATGSSDNTVRLWRTSDWRMSRTLNGHKGAVVCLSFSPNGSLLASGSLDTKIRIWNVEIGRCVHVIHDPDDGPVRSVCFSSDGSMLAGGGDDGLACTWKTRDWSSSNVLAFAVPIFTICSSPTSDLFAIGCGEPSVALWNPISGGDLNHILPSLRVDNSCIHSATFSSDGSLLATGLDNGTIRLWRTSDWTHIRTLQGHTGTVRSLSFFIDGCNLASVSADFTIRLWNVNDGKCVQMVGKDSKSDELWSVCFSPNGPVLASSSGDSVRLWK